MNISLPRSLKSFVEDRVASSGYSSSSEYVREADPQGPRPAALARSAFSKVAACRRPLAWQMRDYFERLRRQRHEAGR